MRDTLEVSIGGERKSLPALQAGGVTVLVRGRLLKTAEIFDEYWLERETLPAPELVLAELRRTRNAKPDLFTFAQRVPDAKPAYGQYHCEFDNYAVLPVSTHEHWLQDQIPGATRRNIRASEKRGITVRDCRFDDGYVAGISSIYNETPVRAGRKFWHFGKALADVRSENGTYAGRSTFLAAYWRDEMVGYLKVVWDRHTAAIMQILSKTAYREYRPNNALLSEAVRQCALRNVDYLIYETFDYGNKSGDSLTRFKENHGFRRMDIPRYYVPLTGRGAVALRLGLHRGAKEKVPEWLASPLRDLRRRWYERKVVGA
jgi:hypothetical protein